MSVPSVSVQPAEFGFQTHCTKCGPRTQPSDPTAANVSEQAKAHQAFHGLREQLLHPEDAR